MGFNKVTETNKPEAERAQILRKCTSVSSSSSPGPHSCTLLLPNYLNVRPLSSPGTPLDFCLLGLGGGGVSQRRQASTKQ